MCSWPRALNAMPGCSPFVFSLIKLCCFPHSHFLRNVLDKRGQRSGRRARRRHGHHQRRGQPRTHRRKERILHLDCRGSCAALAPPSFPVSLYPLALSDTSLSHFFSSLLPLTTAPPPSCQRGTCRRSTERFPKCLRIIATFIICISWPVFTGSVQPLQELSALIDFHVSRKHPEVCISASYALPSTKRILHPPQHISCLLSTRCLKIQTPLNFCQCLHVLCQLRCKMLRRWSKWGHFTALAHSFLLCITSDFFFTFFIWMKIFTPYTRLSCWKQYF